jgi:hypothetical protein
MINFIAYIFLFLFFVYTPCYIIYEAYFSFKAKRRRSPEKWDMSELVFWGNFTKEEFLATYPIYPNGRLYTGFIVNFFEDQPYKVKSIQAINNSGYESVASDKNSFLKIFKK